MYSINCGGNNVLDIVISSVPEEVTITEVLKPDEAEIFNDHRVVVFELAISIKALPKSQRFVYDYRKGDFDGLRSSLLAIWTMRITSFATYCHLRWHPIHIILGMKNFLIFKKYQNIVLIDLEILL